jgi:single-strand DNA-binding protein
MANLNRVLLIGRLTRDPETRVLPSGAKVAKFGFAVDNPRRNATTGEWESNPVFVDIEVWNSSGPGGTQADRAEQVLRKGKQVFIEGRLRLDQWTAQDGQKRSRLYVVADRFQLLEPRTEGAEGGMPRPASPAPARKPGPAYEETPGEPESSEVAELPGDNDIPF